MRTWKTLAALLLITLLTTGIFPLSAFAAPEDAPELPQEAVLRPSSKAFVEDEVIIKYKKNTSKDKKEKIKKDEVLEEVADLDRIDATVVKLKGGKKVADIEKLKEKYPEIESVELNAVTYASMIPNDPYWSSQKLSWERYNIDDMWDSFYAAEITVAVLDTGVYPHYEYSGRLLAGYDFVNSDADPNDDHGHGTRVAGFIAALGNNGYGIAGLNWAAKILPVKVMGAAGTGTASALAKGITYAVDQGAKVLNISLGFSSDSAVVRAAVEYAATKGCVLVAATGNSSAGAVDYPARYATTYNNVIAVGSADPNVGRASYSNYGPGLTVLTQGTGYTTALGSGYAACGGTSFATPLIAGAVAYAINANASISFQEIQDLLAASSVDYGPAGYDTEYGWGYLDYGMLAANLGAVPVPTPTPTPTLTPEPTLIPDPDSVPLAEPDATTPPEDESPVEEDLATPAPGAPELNIVGSQTIILHVGSSYTEQGALASDQTDGNLDAAVTISGYVDTAKAGTYTVTYAVTNSKGVETEVVRRVRVISPTQLSERKPFSFSGSFSKKTATAFSHAFSASASGKMDMMVTVSGGTLQAVIKNAAGKQVYSEQLNKGTTKVFDNFASGSYTLTISSVTYKGNMSYTVNMQMPEVISYSYAEDEIPLSGLSFLDRFIWWIVLVGAAGLAGIYLLIKKRPHKRVH